MRVTNLYPGSYASNCYLVESDGEAILIDPSIPVGDALRLLGTLPRITAILLTHGHFDHTLALDGWRTHTGAPLAIHEADAPMLTDARLSCYRTFLGSDVTFAPPERLLHEGDTVSVGNESLTVLSVPGHTPGSIALLGDGRLFTGDTLFAEGGYGRTDLPGGDSRALVASLRRLLSLPGEYRILPGHGEATDRKTAAAMFSNLM